MRLTRADESAYLLAVSQAKSPCECPSSLPREFSTDLLPDALPRPPARTVFSCPQSLSAALL